MLEILEQFVSIIIDENVLFMIFLEGNVFINKPKKKYVCLCSTSFLLNYSFNPKFQR